MDQAAPAAPAAEVVVPAAPAPGAAASPPVTDTPPPAEPPKPDRTFTQAELDEILEKRLGKEKRKREDIERRLKVTEELALRRTEMDKADAKPPAKDAPTGEPIRDQFGSYEEFIEARAEWRADQKVNKRFEERDAKDRERSAQSEQEKQREAFRKSMKESAKDIEDFDDVLSEMKATDPVANVSAMAIEAAEAPGKVLYHLAKNPEEAERIASLPPGKQAREILRLEEKLSKPPVKPSKAPDPITPVGSGKTALGDEEPDAAAHPEKWMAWRQKSLAANRAKARVS